MALAAGNLVVPRMAHPAYADVHGLSVARAPQFFVRVATHAVRVGHTQLIENVPDLMRLMAVHAGRQHIGLLFPQLTTNGLAVHNLDLRVAFRAGSGNVPAIDRRSRVGMGQDRVRGVAGGAIWCHR